MPVPDEQGESSLGALREGVQRLDREIIGLLAKRMQLAQQIGAAKQALGRPTLDTAREAEVVRRAGEFARDAGLPNEDVRALF
ncbi:MAG: chorismate mutase, partial [Gemmatimonadaceae bacterium]